MFDDLMHRIERSGHVWNTTDEILFLDKLGLWTEKTDSLPRAILLARYLAAMPFRTQWGDVDAVAVRKMATRMLRECSPA